MKYSFLKFRTPHSAFRIFFAFAIIHQLSTINSFAQLPTNNLAPASVAVTTDTSGNLLAPANFFTANSNALNGALGPVRSSTNLLITSTTNLPGALVVNTTNISGGITNTNTSLTFNGSALTNLTLGKPVAPLGPDYTNNADLGGNTAAFPVVPNAPYVAVITNANNAVLDAENANDIGFPGGIISTPDSVLYAFDGAGTLAGQPVQEQLLFPLTTNAGYFYGASFGTFNGAFTGSFSGNGSGLTSIPSSALPGDVVFNDQSNLVTWTSGQFVFKANVAGRANNQTDDGIVIWQANSNKWSTVKYLNQNGTQVGAIGFGNSSAGVGSDTTHTNQTYYTNVGFEEMGNGFYHAQNEKLAGGWINYSSSTSTDTSGDFVVFWHTNGMGYDTTSDSIDWLVTNVSFRVSATTGNVSIGTNGHGALTLGQAPTFQKTNAAPSSVTIGATAPDLWIPITNNGVAFYFPVWINH